jgi:Rrf2 family protein
VVPVLWYRSGRCAGRIDSSDGIQTTVLYVHEYAEDFGAMHVPAKADYAIRAVVAIAAAGGGPISGASIAASQQIPAKFLESILADLRRARIVTSTRGAEGGYSLARPAREIALADVIRVVDGPLAEVRGSRPEATTYDGSAAPLRDVWLAVRVALRRVLERTSIADVASGKLPTYVCRLLEDPDVLVPH